MHNDGIIVKNFKENVLWDTPYIIVGTLMSAIYYEKDIHNYRKINNPILRIGSHRAGLIYT